MSDRGVSCRHLQEPCFWVRSRDLTVKPCLLQRLWRSEIAGKPCHLLSEAVAERYVGFSPQIHTDRSCLRKAVYLASGLILVA